MSKIHSIVYWYFDWDTQEECISVGNRKYMQQTLQGAKTLIWVLWLVQTEEERDEMLEMEQQELYDALMQFRDDNRLLVEYPQ